MKTAICDDQPVIDANGLCPLSGLDPADAKDGMRQDEITGNGRPGYNDDAVRIYRAQKRIRRACARDDTVARTIRTDTGTQ
jgi:hypothetical protein